MEIFFVVINSLSIFFHVLLNLIIYGKQSQGQENGNYLKKKYLGCATNGFFIVSLFFILRYFGIDFFKNFFGWIIIVEFCWVAINMFLDFNSMNKTKSFFLTSNIHSFGCLYYLTQLIGFSTLIYQVIIFFKN
jgi:hypothetical protein